jgi:Dioxygenases related to 2-nitropropane dioxygenase
MAFQNRVTEILGIKYPIMQGGMQNLGTPQLAAAISNAGGLGTINISMWPDFDEFRAAVRETKKMTGKPMCVNISMIPNVDMGDKITKYIDICGEEGVEVMETSGVDPSHLVPQIHSYGMKHIHKVPAVKHAIKAAKGGVDVISIVGSEGAGHPSPDLIGGLVLAAKLNGKLDVPFMLGGGIADGKGLAAAFALGAEGVVVGTRFIACTECLISENHKQWIVDATERDTVLCQRAIKNMVRVANNGAAQECLEMEKTPGVTLQDLMPIISGAAGKAAYASGDTSKGMFAAGQNIGLIDSVESAEEIIDSMVAEASAIITQLQTLTK